jgi:hypothetical protein
MLTDWGLLLDELLFSRGARDFFFLAFFRRVGGLNNEKKKVKQ